MIFRISNYMYRIGVIQNDSTIEFYWNPYDNKDVILLENMKKNWNDHF